MTGRRYPAKSQFVKSEDDESSRHFGGVAMPPRFPRKDVAKFACRLRVGSREVGDADQLIIERRDGEGERSSRLSGRLANDLLEIRRGVSRRVWSPR